MCKTYPVYLFTTVIISVGDYNYEAPHYEISALYPFVL
jgi:hypothetical protein